MATIWKFALVVPAMTITEAGALMAALLTVIAGNTAVNPADAKVTVQFAVPRDGTLEGEQLTPLN